MNLRDRLEQIFQQPGSREQRPERAAAPEAPRLLSRLLGGEMKMLPEGRVISVSRQFPSCHRHGRASLEEIFTVQSRGLSVLSGDPSFDQFDPRQALFLDTETTGLAGGAGTIIFLIGLGYFEQDGFHIRQLFLPSFQDEKAFMSALFEFVTRDSSGRPAFRHLVTFNGKSYDLSLLQTRFVMQRLQNPFQGCGHLDLLYPSRCFWRGRFEDCALQTLERHVLGFQRRNDVPSFLIPGLYFDFLRRGQFHSFDRIFEHNRLDLLSLVNLLTVLCRGVELPSRQHHTNPIAAARLLWRRKEYAAAAALLERCAGQLQWKPLRPELQLELALAKRRLGRFDEALQLCRSLIEEGEAPPETAFREAAKILEHRKGDFQSALRIVELGLGNFPDSGDLHHRQDRLKSRLARRQEAAPEPVPVPGNE